MTEKVEKNKEVEASSSGKVKISNEVVSILAGVSATEVEGVAGMSGGIAGGIAEMLGRENLSKGVKVEVGEEEVAVDLHVVMKDKVKIHEAAQKVQEHVRETIEDRTGLEVVEVNVNVQGVKFEMETKEEGEDESEELESTELPND